MIPRFTYFLQQITNGLPTVYPRFTQFTHLKLVYYASRYKALSLEAKASPLSHATAERQHIPGARTYIGHGFSFGSRLVVTVACPW